MGAKRSELSRVERLRQIEDALFAAAPGGLSVSDLARRFQVHRTTIWRDLGSLDREGVPLANNGTRVSLLRERYVSRVRLNLNEATALFLAARLLSRYADAHNPYVISGIEKLAAAMPRDLIQQHMRLAAAVVRQRHEQPGLTRVLERLTEAWAERRRVRLWQHPTETCVRTEPRLFDPYFIEPSGAGYSLYVIGYDLSRADMRTFHIRRLVRVELTDEHFEPRPDVDLYALLTRAWGINWGAGGVTHRVRLRFPPGRITTRVKASEWHLSQEIVDEPDGGCVLAVTVGDWVEMLPFILQWGGDCEVLEPAELRGEVARMVQAAAALYGAPTGGCG